MKKLFIFLLAMSMTAVFGGSCGAQNTAETATTMEPAVNTQIILTIDQPDMLVNGSKRAIDDKGTVPVILNGRTLLPVRAVVEAMGGTVEWDSESRTVTLSKNNEVLRLVIDSQTAYINGTPHSLDSAPVIINERTMLPIRFIAESFGFDVEWDAEGRRVIINEVHSNLQQKTQWPSTAPTESLTQTLDGNNNSDSEIDESTIIVTVNGQSFTATLEDNETARVFYKMLPLTLEMDELNGNEKYYYLNENLPTDSRNVDMINTGDLMLYGSSCIVSFFKSFETSYAYTPIGHIDDSEGYTAVLPRGSVTITFSK